MTVGNLNTQLSIIERISRHKIKLIKDMNITNSK